SHIIYACIFNFVFFFFSRRRRHTIFSRDWSSDVCSSDLHAYSLRRSREHAAALRAQALPPEVAQAYADAARQSRAEQARLEQNDDVDFDTYVARYHAAPKVPRPA